MKNPYSEDYYRQSKRRYWLKDRLASLMRTWLQPPALARLVRSLPEGARVLDVGCGKGEFLHRLAALRPDLGLFGADFTAAEPLSGYRHVAADAGALPFPDASFDLLISKQLLEHLPHPDAFLDEAHRVLKNGGECYLDCPDARGVSPWMVPNFYDDPTHIRPYTRRALARLFELHHLTPLDTGRLRDWRLVLLGPLYLPVALLARDDKFLPGYLGHLFGLWIYISARRDG